jgi:hypothetical protein
MKNKKLDKFFYIDSIPGVMFLYGETSFKDCKIFNNALTNKEYDDAIKECELRAKAKADAKEKFRKKNAQVVVDGKVVKKGKK